MAYQPRSRRSCPLSFSQRRARVRTYLPLVTLRVTSVMTSWPWLTERRSSNRFPLRERRGSADTRRMCEEGGNGKLEEALRPVFDLSCFSFSQEFDPEMRPLSFLQALGDCPRKRLLQRTTQGSLHQHVWLASIFFLSSFFMCACTSVCLTVSDEIQLKVNYCAGTLDMSLTRLECSFSYRSELS